MHDLAIHRQRLHLAVRKMQDRSTWGFINATALHPNETVLNHVHAANTMLASDFIEESHHSERVQFFSVHCHTISTLEIEFDHLRFIRRIFRQHG